MNWELFYLVCFAVGFTFSALSFFGGLHRFHFHVHLPKHFHFGGAGHGAGAVHAGHGAGVAKGVHFGFINPMTIAAFLTWFGGTGYLLVRFRHIWVWAGLTLASAAGLVASSIVFGFVAKVLMANDYEIDPIEYEMVGVLGRVSVPIRKDGTGELIYTQLGVRKACAARCDEEEAMAKGEEVVVTRYERGVAYVRRYEDLANPAELPLEGKTTS
jgi:hypothetical protein